ncbi:hypothetical protein Hanom_Chr04g00361541 [Helianthus anomalus]
MDGLHNLLDQQTGYLGLWGAKVDAIEHHETKIKKLSGEVNINPSIFGEIIYMPEIDFMYFSIQIAEERKNVMDDPKAILPVTFLSFKTRWEADVAAQTQQVRNLTLWLTGRAP